MEATIYHLTKKEVHMLGDYVGVVWNTKRKKKTIKGDDGLLVRDLNGNGVIDSGQELFGGDTVLANGQKATDAYAALKDLDSNRDGIIDANDAIPFPCLNDTSLRFTTQPPHLHLS